VDGVCSWTDDLMSLFPSGCGGHSRAAGSIVIAGPCAPANACFWLDASSHDCGVLCRLATSSCATWTLHSPRGMTRVLCVAEKPSIAKAVANHLGGQVRTVCTYMTQMLRIVGN
jgi:hypothetical protein